MEQQHTADYFLGANSEQGFASLYDGFVDLEGGDFLWVIKGGPGCGKSSFMRRLAEAGEARGEPVERIFCSGDPDSLDGVYFPHRRVAYVDGTAPHVIEATYPGAASLYLDLGAFFNASALAPQLPEIIRLNREYKAKYDEAYRLIAAAGALSPRSGFHAAALTEKLEKKAAGLAARELHRRQKPGRASHRFLSAVSCKGCIWLEETIAAYPHCTLLDNEFGLAAEYLALLAAHALRSGCDAICCHDPLWPEKLQALLLPESGRAYVAVDRNFPLQLHAERHARLDALAEKSLTAAERAQYRSRRKQSAALLRAATDTLAQAKCLHDELERVHNPCVDFDGVFALAQAHAARLFS